MTEKKVLWVHAVDHTLLGVERKRVIEVLESGPLAAQFYFIVADKHVELMTREDVLNALKAMRETRGKLPLKYRILRKLRLK